MTPGLANLYDIFIDIKYIDREHTNNKFNPPVPKVTNLFTAVIHVMFIKARLFVPGRLLQLSSMWCFHSWVGY
jgi:hypothetical protein